MKICWNCGAGLDDNSLFCNMCGAKQPDLGGQTGNQYSNNAGNTYQQGNIYSQGNAYQQGNAYMYEKPSQQYMSAPEQNHQENASGMYRAQNLKQQIETESRKQLIDDVSNIGAKTNPGLLILTILSCVAAAATIVLYAVFFITGGISGKKDNDETLETDQFIYKMVEAWNSGTAEEMLDVTFPERLHDSARIKLFDHEYFDETGKKRDLEYTFQEYCEKYSDNRKDKNVKWKILHKTVLARVDQKHNDDFDHVREQIQNDFCVDVGTIEAAIVVYMQAECSDGDVSGDRYLIYRVDGKWYGFEQ